MYYSKLLQLPEMQYIFELCYQFHNNPKHYRELMGVSEMAVLLRVVCSEVSGSALFLYLTRGKYIISIACMCRSQLILSHNTQSPGRKVKALKESGHEQLSVLVAVGDRTTWFARNRRLHGSQLSVAFQFSVSVPPGTFGSNI